MTDDNHPAVFLFHNVVSPYRLPLFESLSKETDLRVLFGKQDEAGRKWDTSLSEQETGYDHEILPNLQIGPIIINYTLPWVLFEEQPDAYIVADTPGTLLTMLLTVLFAKVYDIELYFWTGWLDTSYSSKLHTRSPFKVPLIIGYRMFKDAVQRFCYRCADGFVAYSSESVEYLESRGANPQRIFVGGQIMPEEELADASPNDGINRYNDTTVVLYLGYLNRRKGVDYLLSAWDALKQNAGGSTLGDAVLVIAGSGPHGDTLRQVARYIDDVEFVGHVKGEEKAHYYDVADIFVLPTLHDPWGLVVNEAVSFDLPVIVTEAAGSKDFVRKEGVGVVVEPADSTELERAVRRLITDEQYRKNLTQSAADNESATDRAIGIRPFIELLAGHESEQELIL